MCEGTVDPEATVELTTGGHPNLKVDWSDGSITYVRATELLRLVYPEHEAKQRVRAIGRGLAFVELVVLRHVCVGGARLRCVKARGSGPDSEGVLGPRYYYNLKQFYLYNLV